MWFSIRMKMGLHPLRAYLSELTETCNHWKYNITVQEKVKPSSVEAYVSDQVQ